MKKSKNITDAAIKEMATCDKVHITSEWAAQLAKRCVSFMETLERIERGMFEPMKVSTARKIAADALKRNEYTGGKS